MTLEEYLKKMNISVRKFAMSIGVSNTTIHNVLKGKRPYRRTAILISHGSYNQIKVNELMDLSKRKPQIPYK